MDLRPIHLFGDSIGKGIMFDEGRGRYAIARERCDVQLQSALNVPVENHARMGATVAEGLQDFLECGDIAGTIVVIEYGGNDCDLKWDEVAKDPSAYHEAKVPLETFRRLLKEFVLKVRRRNAAPLLVTAAAPCMPSVFLTGSPKGWTRMQCYRYLIDVQNIYRWQERYAIAVRDAALETGCDIFDLRDVFLSRRDVADLISLDRHASKYQRPYADNGVAFAKRLFVYQAGPSLSAGTKACKGTRLKTVSLTCTIAGEKPADLTKNPSGLVLAISGRIFVMKRSYFRMASATCAPAAPVFLVNTIASPP